MNIPHSIALAIALTAPAFSFNDDCASPTPISLGVIAFDTSTATPGGAPWSCVQDGGQDLWYLYVAESGHDLVVSTCASSFDTVLEVRWNCAPGTAIVCNDDSCGTGSEVRWTPILGSRFYIRVGGSNGASGPGTLELRRIVLTSPQDGCGGALPVTDGTTQFSTVGATESMPVWSCASESPDLWFAFTSNGAVTIDTFGSGYDTTLELFEGSCNQLVSIACNDDSAGSLQSVVSSPPTVGVTYYLRVGGHGGAMGAGMLNVAGAGWPPRLSLGETYCETQDPNSTGTYGHIFATGSPYIADNDLLLRVNDLPDHSFGFFFVSRTGGTILPPGGQPGILCVGGHIGRYNEPGQIFNSGTTGAAVVQIDLLRTPTPFGLLPMMRGDRWHFQAWFRDTSMQGIPTSAFTDALAVDFF